LRIKKLKQLLEGVKHEELRYAFRDSSLPFGCPLEALLLPIDTDEARYRAIRALSDTETMNKVVLATMIFLQWYTNGRYN
jgi:hypothetical protein